MIGKTRQIEQAFRDGCGVLRHSPPTGPYRHVRFAPPVDLADWVEHFWCETWQFATAQTREIVPHPCVHLALTPTRSSVVGVQTSRFVRELSGEGRVFGVKFRAGAFYPILGKPVCSIANNIVPAERLFPRIRELERAISACDNELLRVEAAAHFLRTHLPRQHPNAALAARAVGEIIKNPSLNRVQTLAARVELGERSLQRLFRRHVGVGARWVINRYRLFDALQHLSGDSADSLADLALTLGYFDQAHFTNDFTRSVGRAPARYARP